MYTTACSSGCCFSLFCACVKLYNNTSLTINPSVIAKQLPVYGFINIQILKSMPKSLRYRKVKPWLMYCLYNYQLR